MYKVTREDVIKVAIMGLLGAGFMFCAGAGLHAWWFFFKLGWNLVR